jgi:6-phosphogluconate dehydrogenase
MVHDGIEHGVMQLIAETYDLMSRGLGMSDVAIKEVYSQWSVSEVSSRLLEIIARRLRDNNGGIGATLLELVFEGIAQNGSGRWTSLEARDLDVPTPTIDIAVAMQMLSGLEEGRMALRRLLRRRPIRYAGKPGILIDQIKRALCAGMIVTFAQGMALLRVASEVYAYDLALEDVARIWRGGAIRSQMLQEIYEAFYVQPHLPNLLSDWQFAHQLQSRHEDLRAVVRLALDEAIPVPALNASLAYDAHASVLLQCTVAEQQTLKRVRNSV